MFKAIKRYLRDSIFYIIGRINPKMLAGILYKRAFKHSLNWDNPKDINEKINWLKFNSDTSRWPDLADKYKVREYVRQCGLEDMLIPLYGKWDRAEDIDWDALPNEFVMKTNHGSGDAFICKDKQSIDKVYWTKYFAKLLKEKFGYKYAEPHYNKIKPCVIAEKLMDNTKQAFASSSIADYKIWCFDGVPAYIWLCYNRTKHSTDVKLFDLDWNFHPEYSKSIPHYVLSDEQIPRPESLDKMLEAASILSKGFPELRVDFYEIDGKAYFGEITLSSASGYNDFYADEFLRILGDKINLNM